MPRNSKHQKSGGGGSHKKFGKNFKHTKGKRHFSKVSGETDKFKKFKHIQRNQQTEEALRRQKEVELSSGPKTQILESSSDDDDVSPMDQLLESLQSTKNRSAIESSCSSDEDVVDEEEDEELDSIEENEDVDENEEEDDDDSSESNSDDDLPEETVLRPEGSKQKAEVPRNIEDNFEENANEESDDEEIDEETEKATDSGESLDMFSIHLNNELSPDLLECVHTTRVSNTYEVDWKILGRIIVDIPTASKATSDEIPAKKQKKNLLGDEEHFAEEGHVPERLNHKSVDMTKLFVKNQILQHIGAANKVHVTKANISDSIVTGLQAELFSIMNNYQDLYYPHRSHENGEEIRLIYCMHALNHLLKTRTKIMHHNAKLGKSANAKTPAIIPDAYRDQGLFRPKVLIIVPFRDSALRVINTLISLIYPEMGSKVMHYNRFAEEFGGKSLHFSERNPKPEDYQQTFDGNSDDTFRLGISFTRKCMKLFSDFYTSDLLIASPLGLRMIIGAPGDKDRDYDFLASIELLILDQADLFLAQNWDHLLHVLDHLHLQPKSARDTDFSRVRPWCLNGWTRFYRQTLLFSSHELPEFRSLFNSRCANYRGKVRVANPIITGTIRHVAVQIPQVSVDIYNSLR